MNRIGCAAALALLVGVPNLRAQSDCNGNGVSDTVDIAGGTAADCNGNGVPDTCDLSGAPGLALHQTVPAGALPMSLAAADMDGDGDTDLFVADRTGNQVIVLLNAGGGVFAPVTLATGTAPESVVAADLNGDGLSDLAAVNSSSHNVSVIMNEGLDGSGNLQFAPAVSFPVGSNPTFIVALDLNEDDVPDLATANRFSNSVTQLLNDGSGGFTSSGSLAVGLEPIAMTAGHFDSDDLLDLAVTNLASNNLSVLLSTGRDVPPTPASFATPFAITSADFDGDGDDDVAVGNFASTTVAILVSDGQGSFSPGPELSGLTAPSALAAADLNADGIVDLVVADAVGVHVYTGMGGGAFLMTRHGNLGGLVNSIAIGSYTQAGLQIAIADEQGARVAILREETLQPQSGDCNANGVPDECEPDSDGNGVIDACEPPSSGGGGTGSPPADPPSGQQPPAAPGCGAGALPLAALALAALQAGRTAGWRRRRGE